MTKRSDFGKQAEDKITGRSGVITALHQNIDGVDEYRLEYLDDNGKTCSFWSSIARLKITAPTKKKKKA